MPSALEITRALYGTWRLARLDRTGMTWFEATPEGFWRSFFAFAIVAPGYALLKLVEHIGDATLAASVPRIFMVDAIAYVVQIVAYPLAMLFLCRAYGKSDRYIGLHRRAQLVGGAAVGVAGADQAFRRQPSRVGGIRRHSWPSPR